MACHHLKPAPDLVDNKQRLVTPKLRLSDQSRAEIMDEVRTALYDYGDLNPLAEAIGRSVGCLYQIRGGYTRWPRWETLFALLPPLGLELKVAKISRKLHS